MLNASAGGNRNHPNYEEKAIVGIQACSEWNLIVDPPIERKRRRRSTSERRTASPWNRQLVMLIVDDSSSMSRNSKAKYATKTAREVVRQCQLKSGKMACFDVAIFAYGNLIKCSDNHILRPVTEVNASSIEYHGVSGETKIRMALQGAKFLLDGYNEGYYKLHKYPELVPPPLIFLLSDGYNGDGNPVPDAAAIKEMDLAIKQAPMLATVGIETGGTKHDVPHELMKRLASKNSNGEPAYFEINDLNLLVELIATTSSSFINSTDDLIDEANRIRRQWNRPNFGGTKGIEEQGDEDEIDKDIEDEDQGDEDESNR